MLGAVSASANPTFNPASIGVRDMSEDEAKRRAKMLIYHLVAAHSIKVLDNAGMEYALHETKEAILKAANVRT